MKPFESEQHLASFLIEHLMEQGYKIYKEVCTGGRRADVVGTKDDLTHIFETKMSFTTSLLKQLVSHLHHQRANAIWAVIPWKHYGYYDEDRQFITTVCHAMGFGLIRLNCDERITKKFDVQLEPTIMEVKRDLTLFPMQQVVGNSGSNKGGYWTTYQQMKLELIEYVMKHPDCTFKEAAVVYEKHYPHSNSAASTLCSLVHNRAITEIGRHMKKNKYRLYVTKEGKEWYDSLKEKLNNA